MTYRYRSAVTGRFIPAWRAKRYPKSTVKERIKPKAQWIRRRGLKPVATGSAKNKKGWAA